MDFKEKSEEILRDVERAMSGHMKASTATFLIAIVLYLGGLAAFSLSYATVAAALFLSGLHFTLHYFRNLVIHETLQQTRVFVHLFRSLSTESRNR